MKEFLVATDMRPFGLLSTVLVTHLLGMGSSTQVLHGSVVVTLRKKLLFLNITTLKLHTS